LDGRELLGIPKILEMWVWTANGVLKKKIYDLSRFREVLEASGKSLRMDLSLLASWVVGVFINKVSFTNLLWEVVAWIL
jgi:hypothetical protein